MSPRCVSAAFCTSDVGLSRGASVCLQCKLCIAMCSPAVKLVACAAFLKASTKGAAAETAACRDKAKVIP